MKVATKYLKMVDHAPLKGGNGNDREEVKRFQHIKKPEWAVDTFVARKELGSTCLVYGPNP